MVWNLILLFHFAFNIYEKEISFHVCLMFQVRHRYVCSFYSVLSSVSTHCLLTCTALGSSHYFNGFSIHLCKKRYFGTISNDEILKNCRPLMQRAPYSLSYFSIVLVPYLSLTFMTLTFLKTWDGNIIW
jgi:hypothetical protein